LQEKRQCFSRPCPVESAAFDSRLSLVIEIHAGEFLDNHNVWYVLCKVLVEKILKGGDQCSIVKTFFVLTRVKTIAIAIAIFAYFCCYQILIIWKSQEWAQRPPQGFDMSVMWNNKKSYEKGKNEFR
jgi:hypothetical protein